MDIFFAFHAGAKELIIVGLLITGKRESKVEIRIRTYLDSITSVYQGAGRIEDYTSPFCFL